MKLFLSAVSKSYALLALFVLLLVPHQAQAQEGMPETLAYQGYLTQSDGTPYDGIPSMVFRLYDAKVGGDAQWRESYPGVQVSQGLFSVRLGRSESLADVAFNRPLWLGIQVDGGSELIPRVALEASPYALSVRGLSVMSAEDEDYGVVPNLVGGYAGNVIQGSDIVGATINGGGGESVENIIAQSYGTIGGGFQNRTTGTGATVGGGRRNQAMGCYDTVAGGENNVAQTDDLAMAFKSAGQSCNATVGGGRDNAARGDGATIAGGVGNQARRSGATVGGGTNNRATESRATVSGGRDNVASEDGATVPGGEDNQARGQNSLAAGYNARAIHEGVFAWSDNGGASSDSLVSTGENQFLIRARGGVGIGTNAPAAALHVTNTESNRDLVLGGTDDSLFGDDGVITSDPAYESSDLWLVSNDAVLVMLDGDDSGETSEFIVADDDLDVLLQVDGFGVTETNHIEVQRDLKPGTAPAEGGVYRDNVVYAWARVNADGTVASSYGCTVSKSATGSYRVIFERELPNGASATVTARTVNDPILATAVTSASQASVATKFFNGSAFVFADSDFYIQVVGRP